MPTLYHHICGFSTFNTLTKAFHEIVSILQVIPSFFVFNKTLEISSYIPHFSQCCGAPPTIYSDIFNNSTVFPYNIYNSSIVGSVVTYLNMQVGFSSITNTSQLLTCIQMSIAYLGQLPKANSTSLSQIMLV